MLPSLHRKRTRKTNDALPCPLTPSAPLAATTHLYCYRNDDSSAERRDTLLFTDLKREDVSITCDGDHLVIKDHHSDSQVTVQYHFDKNDGGTCRIDEIGFADGSTLDYDAINRLMQSNNNS